jgi:hypothetical protein
MTRTLRTLLLAVLLMSGLVAVGAHSAAADARPGGASAAPSTLSSDPAYNIVRWFSYPNSWGNDIPLRTGTATWGYRHISQDHGYNSTCIQQAITWGTKTTSGTSDTYLQRWTNSWGAQWFKVVVERGSGYKGIITAYNDLGTANQCP